METVCFVVPHVGTFFLAHPVIQGGRYVFAFPFSPEGDTSLPVTSVTGLSSMQIGKPGGRHNSNLVGDLKMLVDK